MYPTEVFTLETRAKGAALATVAFSIAGGTINEIVPYLITAVGFWVFVIFALINFAMLPIIWAFYIGKRLSNLRMTSTDFGLETANRNLEEFDLLFSSKSVFAWRAEKEFAAMKSRENEKVVEAVKTVDA